MIENTFSRKERRNQNPLINHSYSNSRSSLGISSSQYLGAIIALWFAFILGPLYRAMSFFLIMWHLGQDRIYIQSLNLRSFITRKSLGALDCPAYFDSLLSLEELCSQLIHTYDNLTENWGFQNFYFSSNVRNLEEIMSNMQQDLKICAEGLEAALDISTSDLWRCRGKVDILKQQTTTTIETLNRTLEEIPSNHSKASQSYLFLWLLFFVIITFGVCLIYRRIYTVSPEPKLATKDLQEETQPIINNKNAEYTEETSILEVEEGAQKNEMVWELNEIGNSINNSNRQYIEVQFTNSHYTAISHQQVIDMLAKQNQQNTAIEEVRNQIADLQNKTNELEMARKRTQQDALIKDGEMNDVSNRIVLLENETIKLKHNVNILKHGEPMPLETRQKMVGSSKLSTAVKYTKSPVFNRKDSTEPELPRPPSPE